MTFLDRVLGGRFGVPGSLYCSGFLWQGCLGLIYSVLRVKIVGQCSAPQLVLAIYNHHI